MVLRGAGKARGQGERPSRRCVVLGAGRTFIGLVRQEWFVEVEAQPPQAAEVRRGGGRRRCGLRRADCRKK